MKILLILMLSVSPLFASNCRNYTYKAEATDGTIFSFCADKCVIQADTVYCSIDNRYVFWTSYSKLKHWTSDEESVNLKREVSDSAFVSGLLGGMISKHLPY